MDTGCHQNHTRCAGIQLYTERCLSPDRENMCGCDGKEVQLCHIHVPRIDIFLWTSCKWVTLALLENLLWYLGGLTGAPTTLIPMRQVFRLYW